MTIEYLDDITDITASFFNHFVMSWEEFQIKQKDWIDEMKDTGYPIDRQWYDYSFLWDRLDTNYPRATMKEALDFLRDRSGQVMLLTEKDDDTYPQGKKTVAYAAKADACLLADRIEYDWYESYKAAESDMYIEDTLPEDLYVFDPSMKWCVVFTHETTEPESETTDLLKTAEYRFCFICKQ